MRNELHWAPIGSHCGRFRLPRASEGGEPPRSSRSRGAGERVRCLPRLQSAPVWGLISSSAERRGRCPREESFMRLVAKIKQPACPCPRLPKEGAQPEGTSEATFFTSGCPMKAFAEQQRHHENRAEKF